MLTLERIRLFLIFTAGVLFMAAIATSQAEARMIKGFKQQQNSVPSWYLGVSASMDFVNDAEITDYDTTTSLSGVLSMDQGYGLKGALGYRPRNTQTFWDNIRVEGEMGYHDTDIQRFTANSGGSVALSGDTYNVKTVMANMYVDIDAAPNWRPYLGFGLGGARATIDNSTLTGDEQDDTVFAYQGMVGLTYIPSSMPAVELHAGYRYLATDDMEFIDATDGSRAEIQYDSHNLEAGARFYF